MQLLPLSKRPHERPLRIAWRDLACLRRWLAASVTGRLASAAPSSAVVPALAGPDRRDAGREHFETRARFRPISAGGIGAFRPAAVRDVSEDGIALRTAEPCDSGQRISIEVHPPAELARQAAGGDEQPIHLLAIVRYCRADGDGHILGCSIGVDWAASLASQMFPADHPALRKSA